MSDLKTRFVELTRKPYAEQAKWYLNGFWLEGGEAEAEAIWDFVHKFVKLDDGKKDGFELDEFKAHRFLEGLGETLTVVKMREKLKQIDLDVNGRMALIEYLLFRYNKSVEATVNAPQGDNREALAEAEQKVAAVQEALDEVQKQLQEQKEALAAQMKAEADAKQRQKESDAAANSAKSAEAQAKKSAEAARSAAEAAKASEAEARKSESAANEAASILKEAESQAAAAEAEVKAAVDDLKSQETAYADKISALDTKSKDTSTGQVARSKAAAELAQLKQENPLPLRKAKLTQEAALRVLEKKRKEAEAAASKAEAAAQEAASQAEAAAKDAREAERTHQASEDAARQAESARHEAEAALQAANDAAADAEAKRLESEESTRRVEEAVRETEEAYAEAVRYFEEVKAKPGTPHGSIWWMQRELKEAQKYLPKKKQTL